MPAIDPILVDGDDTIPAGITDFSAGGGPFWDDIDEDADTPNDSDGIEFNTDTSEDLWFSIPDMPSDFGTMDSPITIKYRFALSATKVNDVYEMRCELYDADKATRMHAITGLQERTTTTFSTVQGFPGSVIAGSKAQWNAVLMRAETVWTQTKSADGFHLRLSAFHAEANYTIATGRTCVIISRNNPNLQGMRSWRDKRSLAEGWARDRERGLYLPERMVA